MRLIGVAMVKNEADIVEAFVRHHAALLDHLIVVDHASSDRTSAILASLVHEGLALTIVQDAGLAFRQAEHLTLLLHDAMPRHGADYAFALDADEFVLADSREALHAALAAAAGPALALPWSLYVPRDDAAIDPNPLRSLTLRAECGRSSLHKVVVRREFAQRRWLLGPGNHWVFEGPGNPPPEVPLSPLGGVTLAHLPFRSPAQFLSKIVLGWFGNRLLQGPDARTSPINWHWRELFYQWLRGTEPGWDALREHAIEWYLLRPTPESERVARADVTLHEDPLPCTFELRYTPRDAADPLRRLATWADAMLDRINPA